MSTTYDHDTLQQVYSDSLQTLGFAAQYAAPIFQWAQTRDMLRAWQEAHRLTLEAEHTRCSDAADKMHKERMEKLSVLKLMIEYARESDNENLMIMAMNKLSELLHTMPNYATGTPATRTITKS